MQFRILLLFEICSSVLTNWTDVTDNPLPFAQLGGLTVWNGKDEVRIIDRYVRSFNITTQTFSTLPSLPYSFGTSGFDMYLDTVYFASAQIDYTKILRYNLTLNALTTSTQETMPYAVIYPCVVVLESQHKVLVIGGDGRLYRARSNKTRIFDIPTSMWTLGQDTNFYSNYWCTNVEHTVYKFGGYDYINGLIHGRIEKVDMSPTINMNLENRPWILLDAVLTLPRHNGGGNEPVHGIDPHIIYLIGGTTDPSGACCTVKNVDIFDARTETITAGKELPRASRAHGSINAFDTIYLFGGFPDGINWMYSNDLSLTKSPTNIPSVNLTNLPSTYPTRFTKPPTNIPSCNLTNIPSINPTSVPSKYVYDTSRLTATNDLSINAETTSVKSGGAWFTIVIVLTVLFVAGSGIVVAYFIIKKKKKGKSQQKTQTKKQMLQLSNNIGSTKGGHFEYKNELPSAPVNDDILYKNVAPSAPVDDVGIAVDETSVLVDIVGENEGINDFNVVKEWFDEDVDMNEWDKTRYFNLFIEHGFENLTAIKKIKEQQLEKMGVKMGHINIIMSAIAQL
eukprot:121039_1